MCKRVIVYMNTKKVSKNIPFQYNSAIISLDRAKAMHQLLKKNKQKMRSKQI